MGQEFRDGQSFAMPEVIWTTPSSDDLERHFQFLATKNLDAAVRAVQTIIKAGSSLENFPRRGTLLEDGSDRRKLQVDFGKYGYTIVYRLEQDTVLILRLYHGREARRSQ